LRAKLNAICAGVNAYDGVRLDRSLSRRVQDNGENE
jgi:hypothetical protein